MKGIYRLIFDVQGSANNIRDTEKIVAWPFPPGVAQFIVLAIAKISPVIWLGFALISVITAYDGAPQSFIDEQREKVNGVLLERFVASPDVASLNFIWMPDVYSFGFSSADSTILNLIAVPIDLSWASNSEPLLNMIRDKVPPATLNRLGVTAEEGAKSIEKQIRNSFPQIVEKLARSGLSPANFDKVRGNIERLSKNAEVEESFESAKRILQNVVGSTSQALGSEQEKAANLRLSIMRD